MKKLVPTVAALALFAGTAMASDSRPELDSDLLSGHGKVTPNMAQPAKPGMQMRGQIDTDMLNGGTVPKPSASQKAVPRIAGRPDLETDLMYGSGFRIR